VTITLGEPDSIIVTTSGVGRVNFAAAWRDATGSGNASIAIESAGDVEGVAAPTTEPRLVHSMSAVAVAANVVTISQYNGTTTLPLFTASLLAGERMVYAKPLDEPFGDTVWLVYNAIGSVKNPDDIGAGPQGPQGAQGPPGE